MSLYRNPPPSPSAPGTLAKADDVESLLIARAKTGDSDAIGRLYERYAPQIRRYIAARLGDPAQAEDICGDVFVKVLESLDRYEDRGWPFSFVNICELLDLDADAIRAALSRSSRAHHWRIAAGRHISSGGVLKAQRSEGG